MTSDGADTWKRNYFAALKDVEDKERAVAAADELMRHAVAKLSVIGNGLHPKLDRELEGLRKAARGNADGASLRRLIDQLSETVRTLDLQGATSSARDSAFRDWLHECFAVLEFPARLRDDAAGLSARLARTTDLTELRDLGRDVLGLIRRALAAGDPPAGPGVAAARIADPGGAAARQQGPLAQTLMRLLDHIALPASFQARAQEIRERLQRGAGDWQQELDAVAGLVADVSRQAQQEKSELESFLHQLAERLGELDRHLQGAEHERQASLQSGRALDSAFMTQVSGIETSVREAASLGDLKAAVQQRLDGLREHLDRYRQEEAQRQQRMQAELHAVTSRLQTLEEESTRLRTHLEERQRQSLIDPLTGIANRTAFEERLAQEHATWKRYRTPLALMVVDVDRFKQINDTQGHKAGDRALALIARVLSQALRETDLLARYGGEEFVVVLPQTAPQAVGGVAEKLRTTVERCNFHNGGVRVPITVSVSYASFRDGDRAEDAFERADNALYRAKRAGRNCCESGDMDAPQRS